MRAPKIKMGDEGYIIYGLGKRSEKSPFEVLQIIRGFTGPDDIEFDIHYCGISQFDVQFSLNELGNTNYPIVPGREMTGLVRFVGEQVKNHFRIGEAVGVGTLVDSCLDCNECGVGREHACLKGYTMAFNEPTKHGHIRTNTGYSMGGFSQRMTVNHHFVIKIPHKYPLNSAAACLTSGTSCYIPLKRFGALKPIGTSDAPKQVGVIGLGNIGMIGIRLSQVMGCEVFALSAHDNKEELALELGARGFYNWSKTEDMKRAFAKFDIILNTLHVNHSVVNLLPFLRHDGVIVQLGLFTHRQQLPQYPFMMRHCLTVSGYISSSVKNTRDTLEFFAERRILPLQTVVLADQLDDVFKILANPATTVARYTLDVNASFTELMKSLKAQEATGKDLEAREDWLRQQRQIIKHSKAEPKRLHSPDTKNVLSVSGRVKVGVTKIQQHPQPKSKPQEETKTKKPPTKVSKEKADKLRKKIFSTYRPKQSMTPGKQLHTVKKIQNPEKKIMAPTRKKSKAVHQITKKVSLEEAKEKAGELDLVEKADEENRKEKMENPTMRKKTEVWSTKRPRDTLTPKPSDASSEESEKPKKGQGAKSSIVKIQKPNIRRYTDDKATPEKK